MIRNVVLAIVFVTVTGNGISLAQPTIVRAKETVPGEVLVKFRRDKLKLEDNVASRLSTITAMKAASGADVQLLKVLPRQNIAVLKFPVVPVPADAQNRAAEAANLASTRSFMTALGAEANAQVIEYVQPNYVYRPCESPNDALINQLRFINVIKLKEGWDVRHDASDVIVAVIDTGTMLAHPDLSGNLWVNKNEIAGNGKDDDANGFIDDVNGWNFYVDRDTPLASNPDAELANQSLPFFGACLQLNGLKFESHGTHVAGIIGARGNNTIGTAGVAWSIKIMPLKFLGGGCGFGDTARAIQAIDYAASNGAKVINCSWGGSPSDGTVDRLLEEAIVAAGQKDVLVVCAAGNSSSDNESQPHFPSNFTASNILAVGATTDDDAVADFSNFGRVSVDLFAPGVNIHSTIPTGNSLPAQATYGDLSGTSMASPIVSGVAALVRAHFPSLTASEVRLWLIKTADPVDSLRSLCVSGGRVNAQRALTAPPLPSTPPAPFQNLSNEDWGAIKSQLKPVDQVRMALTGGLPIDTPITEPVAAGPAKLGQLIEVLMAFSSTMNEDDVRKSCMSNFVEISKVETISKDRNTFRVVGKTTVDPKEFEAVIREGISNIRIVQPNFKYQKEDPK